MTLISGQRSKTVSCLCSVCLENTKNVVNGVPWLLYCPDHPRKNATAINGGIVRTDSNEQRAECFGGEEGYSGVRETLQVFGNDRNFHTKTDISPAVNSGAGRESDLRAEAYLCVVAPECSAEFRAACNNLCGFFLSLGSNDRAAGSGDFSLPVFGGRFSGPGTRPNLRLQGTTEAVGGSILHGSNGVVLKGCVCSCCHGKGCGNCGYE